MLKILWTRKEIAPEQFLLLSTIFRYLMLDLCVKTRIRFSLRDTRLFEITEVVITRVERTVFRETFIPLYVVLYEKKADVLLQICFILIPNILNFGFTMIFLSTEI